MSGEIIEGYCDDLERTLTELIEASTPFTSSDIVVELCATIPLTERLEAALLAAKNVLKDGDS